MPAYVVLILLLIWFQRPEYLTPPNLTSAVPVNQVYRWKWTQEKWSPEPDSDLREARDRLEYLFLDGSDHVDTLQRLKQKSIKTPKDRQKLFEWGYAAYLSKLYTYSTQVDPELRKFIQAAKPPYTYEFIRMRYLVENNIFIANDYLTALGERLALADSTDYAVRVTVTRSIVPSKQGGMKKALKYANDLLVLAPDQAAGYREMAEVYINKWNIRDPNDSGTAREAIRWYNEYLKREQRPTRKKTNEYIIQFVGRINKVLAEQEKQKTKSPQL